MRIIKYLKKFNAFSLSYKIVFITCYFVSALLALIIYFIPLKYYFNLLAFNPSEHTKKKNDKVISVLFQTIRKVKKLAFWDCSCLNQVMTLKIITASMGIRSTINLTLLDYKTQNAKAHASLVFDNKNEFLGLTFKDSCLKLCIN